MKIEIDIIDIVAINVALSNSARRIDELMNDRPDWRCLYEFDKNSVEKAQKVLSKMIANS